ncbi:hypothetical protein MAR_002494 [Mya arenaria]|uniref:Uncharacterized protein n=1 Tax=Mya arenaria TaxID=6604 RepID=A0ABY7FI98_MYAAR|nr:hypothetical protein MAR_002494 [Mya arenaria]
MLRSSPVSGDFVTITDIATNTQGGSAPFNHAPIQNAETSLLDEGIAVCLLADDTMVTDATKTLKSLLQKNSPEDKNSSKY